MKSLCWVDFNGEECPYQSGLNGFKDVSVDVCSDCRRFVDIKDFVFGLLEEYYGGGEFFDGERIEQMFSCLKFLKQILESKNVLEEIKKDSDVVFMKGYDDKNLIKLLEQFLFYD